MLICYLHVVACDIKCIEVPVTKVTSSSIPMKAANTWYNLQMLPIRRKPCSRSQIIIISVLDENAAIAGAYRMVGANLRLP